MKFSGAKISGGGIFWGWNFQRGIFKGGIFTDGIFIAPGMVRLPADLSEVDNFKVCKWSLKFITILDTACDPPFMNVTDGNVHHGCLYLNITAMNWCEARESCYSLGADLGTFDPARINAVTKILSVFPGMTNSAFLN